MYVNFTPPMGAITETGTFRFWCHKVLPLVYDNSLSYYELLCKVVRYLNDVIKNVDTINGNVDGLYAAFIQLQQYVNEYLDSEEMQEKINAKLDEMAENGILTSLVNEAMQGQFETLKRKILPLTGSLREANDENKQTHIRVLRKVENKDSETGKYTSRRVVFRVGSSNFSISLNYDVPGAYGMINLLRDYNISLGTLYRKDYTVDYDYTWNIFMDGLAVTDYDDIYPETNHTSICIYKRQGENDHIVTYIDASGVNIWLKYGEGSNFTLPSIQWLVGGFDRWETVFDSNDGVQIKKAPNGKTVMLMQDTEFVANKWHKMKITW